MATYAQTRAALAAGLTGFTHLFNAMRPLESREPRPDRGCAGNARLLVRPDRRRRACRPGDAAPRVARPRPSHAGDRRDAAGRRKPQDVHAPRRGRFRCARTAASRRTARSPARSSTWRRRCAIACACSACRSSRRCALPRSIPAAFLGLEVGRLAPGYRADMVALDPEQVAVQRTWIAGVETSDA